MIEEGFRPPQGRGLAEYMLDEHYAKGEDAMVYTVCIVYDKETGKEYIAHISGVANFEDAEQIDENANWWLGWKLIFNHFKTINNKIVGTFYGMFRDIFNK